jgi:hypothetical protein
MKHNVVGWFEIPVSKIERAKKFYETVFDFEINVMDFGGTLMGWFPSAGEAYGATGSLIQDKNYTPSTDGTLVYFACENLALELSRITSAGGTVLQKKTQISPEHGYMAVFNDTEGNRVALHSKQ